MNSKYYFTMFKNEPDILTVVDVIRILRMGKNTVYRLLNDGKLSSVKEGRKIIVPKVCLIDYLRKFERSDESLIIPDNRWTSEDTCDTVVLPEMKTIGKPIQKD